MKIGVLGSGDVGRTLAGGFLKYGHQVMLGSRDADAAKLTEWAAQHVGGRTGNFADAARFGDVVILAVKGTAAPDVLRLAGAANLAGKTVIDATNPIADAPPINGVVKFFTTFDQSSIERLQSDFPEVHFVKAFNSVGYALMVNPQFAEGRPTMFICGNNPDAKAVVSEVLDQFGWETADMGSVEAARAIEPLCMLWLIPGFSRNEWGHAFKLLRRA